MSRQKGLIVHLIDPIRTLPRAFPRQPFLARHERAFQHQHHPIHQPVHDLETAVFSQVGGREVALVSAFAL